MLMSRVQEPDLIARIYEAAADPDLWQATWLAVCRAFSADGGMLFYQAHPASPPRVMAMTGWNGSGTRQSGDVYALTDTYPHASPEAAAFSSFVGQEVVTPTLLAAPDVYRDFGKPPLGGAYHVLCATIPLEDTARAGLGLHRPINGKAFIDADRGALEGLARHVAAALRLERLLAEERFASAIRGAALDQVCHGAVIVDEAGDVLFANDQAYDLAATGGLILEDAGGGVSCTDADDAEALSRLIYATARGGAGGSVRVCRPNRQQPLAATVSRLPAALAATARGAKPDRRLALLTVRDLGATPDTAQAQLIDLFGLSAAEAAIVPQLLAGDSAALIAQSRGVAVATIRAQAARVLAKTGATNLRALAAMIAALGGS